MDELLRQKEDFPHQFTRVELTCNRTLPPYISSLLPTADSLAATLSRSPKEKTPDRRLALNRLSGRLYIVKMSRLELLRKPRKSPMDIETIEAH